MRLTPIPKRDLKNVGPAIWRAVDVMEKEFGAQLTHDSGRDGDNGEDATTWIFTFPHHANAQVAVAMNVRKLSMLMRGKTLDGRPFNEVASGLAKFEKRYTNPDKGVASSVLGSRAPYLNPSSANPLLRVVPDTGEISDLLGIYLDATSSTPPVKELADDAIKPAAASVSRRPVTAAELYAKLDRQSEVGRQGEEVARCFEVERLRGLRCPDPENWVKVVALTDIGCGYDIESKWPGHERCIEVKSSTQVDTDFFITDNERKVLAALGPKAWLYRVHVKADGTGEVVLCFPDPMSALPDAAFIPVAFRVDAKALAQTALRPLTK